MSEETKFCTNCKRDVADVNFVIHSAHCHRNIQLCELCNEPVPLKEIDQHIEEFHAQVFCKKCATQLERWQLDDHELCCIKRSVSCQYCTIDCPHDEMKKHEEYCGARTEPCAECTLFVMIKDMDSHKKHKCMKFPQLKLCCIKRTVSCQYCKIDCPHDEMKKHEEYCGARTEPCAECTLFVMLKDMDSHKKDKCMKFPQLKSHRKPNSVPCRLCKSIVLCEQYEDHILHCQKRYFECSNCNKHIKLEDEENHYRLCFQTTGQSFSENVDFLSNHVLKYLLDETEDSQVYSNFMDKRNSTLASALQAREPITPKNKVTKERWEVCPVCREIQASSAISEHMSICGKRTIACPLCAKPMNMLDIYSHLNVCAIAKKEGYSEKSIVSDKINGSHRKTKNTQPKSKDASMNSIQNNCQPTVRDRSKSLFYEQEEIVPGFGGSAATPSYAAVISGPPSKKDSSLKKNNSIQNNSKSTVPDLTRSQFYKPEEMKPCCGGAMATPTYAAVSSEPLSKIDSSLQKNESCDTPDLILGSGNVEKCAFCTLNFQVALMCDHLNTCKALKLTEETEVYTCSSVEPKKLTKKEKKKLKKQNAANEMKSNYNVGTNTQNKVNISASPKYEDVLLPCEFCDELFPDYLIVQHQSGCRPDLVHLPRNSNTEEISLSSEQLPVVEKNLNYERPSDKCRRGTNSGDSDSIPGEFLHVKTMKAKASIFPNLFSSKSARSHRSNGNLRDVQTVFNKTEHPNIDQRQLFPATTHFLQDLENEAKRTSDDNKSVRDQEKFSIEYNIARKRNEEQLKTTHTKMQLVKASKSTPLNDMAENHQNEANEYILEAQVMCENLQTSYPPKQSAVKDSDENLFEQYHKQCQKREERELKNAHFAAQIIKNLKSFSANTMTENYQNSPSGSILETQRPNSDDFQASCPNKVFVKNEMPSTHAIAFQISKDEKKTAVPYPKGKDAGHVRSSPEGARPKYIGTEERTNSGDCFKNSANHDSNLINHNTENRNSEKCPTSSFASQNNEPGGNNNRNPGTGRERYFRGRGYLNFYKPKK